MKTYHVGITVLKKILPYVGCSAAISKGPAGTIETITAACKCWFKISRILCRGQREYGGTRNIQNFLSCSLMFPRQKGLNTPTSDIFALASTQNYFQAWHFHWENPCTGQCFFSLSVSSFEGTTSSLKKSLSINQKKSSESRPAWSARVVQNAPNHAPLEILELSESGKCCQ